MGMFDSDDNIKAQVNAKMAKERLWNNSTAIDRLENRLEKLEEYLELEWSESNGKYYKLTKPTPIDRKM